MDDKIAAEFIALNAKMGEMLSDIKTCYKQGAKTDVKVVELQVSVNHVKSKMKAWQWKAMGFGAGASAVVTVLFLLIKIGL